MERLQRTEFEIKDTPPLSLSAIGSPAAFSTAVKQPGSTTSRAVNNGDSFTNLGALRREPSPQHKEVNGRLSLSSTLSDKGGVHSLNNTCTSVGILDLDAMQDSSMHRFLTSPFDSQDLHLHMSSTMSVPSTQALGATPAISGASELKHPTNIVTTAAEQASLGLPQELLMRQPGPGSEYSTSGEDTETPDLFASQTSHTSSLAPLDDSDGEHSDDDDDDDSDDDNQLAIAEAIKGALDELELTSSSIYTEEGPEYGEETTSQPPPPHTSSSITPGATASQFSASPVTKESGLVHSGIPTAASIPLSSSPIVNGHGGSTSLKLDLSLGAGGERERGGGDETLIGDETEPSVMKEADEFSRFDPSHLSSLLERESFNATSPKSLPSLQNSSTVETKSTTASSLPIERRESEVGDKEVSPSKRGELMAEGKSEEGDVSSRTESALSYSASEGGSPTHTMEGLPSALLAPTSSADDQSTIETSALLASLATPSPPHSQPVNPLLPSTPPHSSSLLGSAPFSAGGFGIPLVSAEGEEGGDKNLSGIYNPFDSNDDGSVESFGQLEFGDHSADSFMAQLAKDEEEIKATHLTPSSEQFQSFSSVLGSSHFSTSPGDSLSMDAYFQKKSGKMGQLSASKLPPSERPRFSDTAGHVIESPDINQSTSTTSSGHMTSIAPPTMHPPLEPIPEGDALDSTLLSENADKGQSPPTLASSSSSQTSSASDDLTPLITAHSPFPAKFDVPKLDFANASVTTQHTISPISGQHRSTGISTSLRNSSPLLQKFNKSSPMPLTGDASSVGLPPELLKPAAVGDDSTTSTLVLKEMSALSLSSPPFVLDPSLMSMPTPSIAKLPSFDITEMTHTQHFASFSSPPQDVTSSDLGLDHSLLHSLTSPGKSNVLSEHAQSTTSPAKLVAGVKSSTANATMESQGLSSENPLSLAGVASSTATRVSKGHSSPSRRVENPLSAAKASPTKILFSPKRPSSSPGQFQVTQVLSTETLTTWSSNSPLTSPPPPSGLISPPPLSTDRNSSAKNANKKSGADTELSSGARSPKTEAAREKLASLQAQLDAARFHADEFLANLKSCEDDSPPAGSGKAILSIKSSSPPTKAGRAPTSSTSTSTSPRLKASPPASSHSGTKKSKSSTSPLSRPSKPFMSMPAHSSSPRKRVAVLETSTTSPGKEKRESDQTAKLSKVSTGRGGVSSDQLSSKRSPSRRRTPGTPTKREFDQVQVHKASAKDGSSPSKVVKSSRIQAEVSSARHVHIQEPQSGLSLKSSGVKRSLMMSSSGESPPLKSNSVKKSSVMSSGAATSDTLSSSKFTLSSLLTSRAHTSPPPLSTLTTSVSPSPSPRGHSPPKTSPPTTSSHPVISTQQSPVCTASQSSQPLLVKKPLMKGPTPHTTMKLATAATVDPSVLKVPDSLCLSQACCVGVSVSDQLMVANLGERWLQMEFRLIHLYRDGTECSLSENVFSLPQRSFVGPEQQENIKVTFSPRTGGRYEAVVAVFAHLVVSSSSAETDKPVASVVVKATAEEPQLEIQTSSLSGSDDGRSVSRPAVLDYGVMVGGSTSTLQLRLANRGHAPLPLCLSITAKSALSQLYFSFGEVPQSLVSVLHPSLLGSSHLLHPHHHTLTLTLPPSPQPSPDKEHSDPEWYSINVCFHAPKKFINDSISDPGPPEEISAQVMLSVNGLTSTSEGSSSSIASIPMQAIVGLARLHVPRAMQSVSMSCAAGRATSRELPFRNAGNIPLRVRLKVSSDHPELFSVSPDFLLIEPKQESQVNVYFSSSSSLVCEGALLIHIEPNGPNYELKLRGEATPTSAPTTATTIATPTGAELETTPTEAAVVTSTATAVVGEGSECTRPGEEVAVGREDEGVLSCNKRVLFWDGVELGKSVYQEVVLHNSYSVAVPLSISIRHPDSSFKLKSVGDDEDVSQALSQQTSEGSRKVELLPGMQLPVGVVYTPTSTTISLSALDITDLLHSKKYRLRLCGYSGRGSVEVVSGRRVTGPGSGGECWVDLGGITRGKRITAKISVYNSGLREAFVTATCYPDKESSSPLPVEHVSVTPSKFIVPPQQIKDLLLVYHTNERDEFHCRSSPALLACIKLTTGDEVMRQRWQKVVTRRLVSSLAASQHRDREAGEREKGEGGASSRLKNASNKVFLAHFPEQEAVVSEPDFSSFELEDEEGVFEEHLTTLTVSLSGSPPITTTAKNKAGSSTAFTVSPPPHTATARLKHKLSLSNTPPVHVAVANKSPPSSSSLTQGLTQSILTAHTLVLPDAQIGHYSEKHLDIHNPYSSDLEWELSYNASPFVRKVRDIDDGDSGGSNSRRKRPSSREREGGDIFKANYSVFWVSERRGVTPPQSTSKVPILFQPHDAGSFSQIWELRVCCDELGTKKLRISFGGRAVANQSTESQQEEFKPRDHQPKSHERTEQIAKWLSQTQHHLPAAEPSAVVSSTTSATPLLRKAVYIKDERVVFLPTKVGSKSTVKVRVCNRGPQRYLFGVIKPVPPFSVDHHNFELGSRQCARLPIHFSPTTRGEYAGVLAIRTNAGHQTFTELRGKSLS